MRPLCEVSSVIEQVNLSKLTLTAHQQKTLRAISLCRTSALGGHVDACDECGSIVVSYNSCRNRHCPKCQGHKRIEWIHKRERDLLPCTYYHVVFTLPVMLNNLALRSPELVYNTLFEASWATLNQFGRNSKVQLGMIAVLHTWGQNLSLHPHLHCIVPGGGVDHRNRWQMKLRSNKYLFSVKAMSKVFRAKYVHLLRKKGIVGGEFPQGLFDSDWVVYAKRPFGGPAQVIKYLGRYTHKVVISNHRIEEVTDSKTTFKYKDYRAGGAVKMLTLDNSEFVRRFSMHILPLRFVRIRHYGILSSSWKRGKLQQLQDDLAVVRPQTTVDTKLRRCPCCKTGTLITIEAFAGRGPPPEHTVAESSSVPVL